MPESTTTRDENVISSQLQRIVAGALRSTIDAHGPITKAWIGSATKRIAHQIKGEALSVLAHHHVRRSLHVRQQTLLPAAPSKVLQP